MDVPHSYKIHKDPIPFLGGITIYIAFSIAIFSILRFESFQANKPLFGILMGGVLIAIVGCIDDFRSGSAITKLFVLALVTYILYTFGIRISIFGQDILDLGLTLLWIVGVTSAMNSLDNMDGASTGITSIAAFFTFLIAWYSIPPQRGVSFFAISLLGACCGFLRYNFKPATIFLGDNGSLMLGFLLASLMVLAGWSKDDPVKALIVPCTILAVPLYDITLSTILRYKNRVVNSLREAIVYCGKDHIAHRLVALGFSERGSVLVLYLCSTISGAIGIFIANPKVDYKLYLPITVIGIICLIFIGMLLDRARVAQVEWHHETSKGPAV
jgi:UDP-GlcNAc:undecaprenyl-phosphate GlcNAc-1-phosphate transferase